MPRVKKTKQPEVIEATNEVEVIKPPKPKPKIKPTAKVPGLETIEVMLGDNYGPVLKMCEKFSRRHGVDMVFIRKFMAFKLLRKKKHLDWITFADLMKVYGSRVRQPQNPVRPPQRPYENNRIY